jgi:hypothetical protein
MSRIRIGTSNVLLELKAPAVQERLKEAHDRIEKVWCLCNEHEAGPLPLDVARLGASFYVRSSRGTGSQHAFGCRHFRYTDDELANRGLSPGTIEFSNGILVVRVGDLLTILPERNDDSGDADSGGCSKSHALRTKNSHETGHRLRDAVGLEELASLLAPRPESGSGSLPLGMPQYWRQIRVAAENIQPRRMVLGDWGLSRLLMLPAAADQRQLDFNARKQNDAHKRRYRIMAAFLVSIDDFVASRQARTIDLPQLGHDVAIKSSALMAALSAHTDHEAVFGRRQLSCPPDNLIVANQVLSAGGQLVLLARGQVWREDEGRKKGTLLSSAVVMDSMRLGFAPAARVVPTSLTTLDGEVGQRGPSGRAPNTPPLSHARPSALETLCEEVPRNGPGDVAELAKRLQWRGQDTIAVVDELVRSGRLGRAYLLADKPRFCSPDKSLEACGGTGEALFCDELLKRGPGTIDNLSSRLGWARNQTTEIARKLTFSGRVLRWFLLDDRLMFD